MSDKIFEHNQKQIDEIWKLFKETDRKMQETDRKMQETDRRMKENERQLTQLFKETDRKMQETSQQMKETDRKMQETARQMRETDKRINKLSGDWGNKWGDLAENLVKGGLRKQFNEKGIMIEKVASKMEQKGVIEYDLVGFNGKEVVVVESKATLNLKDVDEFIVRLQKFKDFWPEFTKKVVYGAVSYLIRATKGASEYAEEKGLFVIEATGDAVIKNTDSFQPKVFSS